MTDDHLTFALAIIGLLVIIIGTEAYSRVAGGIFLGMATARWNRR